MYSEKLLRNVLTYGTEYLFEIKPDSVDLDRYLFPRKSWESMKDLAEILFLSITQRNMMPGVIQFSERLEEMKRILFYFDHLQILHNFTAETLYGEFQGHFPINNKNSANNLWWQFSKSVISACEFLRNFETTKEFDDFVCTFTKNKLTRSALPLLLAQEISGMGFAIGCEFLKEAGYSEYPKPDKHLMDVFSKLNLCERDQYTVYKTAIFMAEVSGVTPNYVDKTFWLICSGKYYLDGIEIKGRKKDFISSCKRKFIEITP